MPGSRTEEYAGRMKGTNHNPSITVDLSADGAAGSVEVQIVGDSGFADAFVANALHARFEWPGREIEVDVDLLYNRARCFDPQPGRWIDHDPAEKRPSA